MGQRRRIRRVGAAEPESETSLDWDSGSGGKHYCDSASQWRASHQGLGLSSFVTTKAAALVSGDSDFERYWVGKTDQEIRLNADRVQEVNLVGISASQLLERISTLPPHAIVLF
jgi:hypothetical protein